MVIPEHIEPLRLVKLLISKYSYHITFDLTNPVDELARKKNKNIKKDYKDVEEKAAILIKFWNDSLTSERILHKLRLRQNQSFS